MTEADDLSVEKSAFDTDAENFSLLDAAALVARVDGRLVDLAAIRRDVNALARRVELKLTSADPVRALQQVLFPADSLECFRGDDEEYDAPRNSFICEVLARRRGLPIALSVLTVEVAARANIRAFGLALPGHFMVAVVLDENDDEGTLAVIDPFLGGRVVPPRELAERLGVPESELGEVLQPARPDQVLVRMLTNLRGSYARRSLHGPLSKVLSRLLLLRPRDPWVFLERAEARRMLLDEDGARGDITAALALSDADDIARAAKRLIGVLDDAHVLLN